ncbi:MAG: DoxX family protein [Acidobacteria bacterium]|nr:DoxX family protein [Acidobacteriota bacterium]MCW5949326.1 DoxX family protein [Pyrinomonadaceae bacterium]
MERLLGRYANYVYSIFRIVIGFCFMLHGTQKMFGWPPSEKAAELAGLVLAAAIIELVGGFLIMIGFFASIAAFIASGTMAVAYFMVHQPKGALPIMNGGELAAVYAFAFLYIAAKGSGLWSVDSLIRGSSAINDQ